MLERSFLKKWLEKIPILSNLYLLLVVCLGWVIFRFTNLELGFTLAKSLFGLNGNPLTGFEAEIQLQSHAYLLLIAAIASTPLLHTLKQKLEERVWERDTLSRVWNAVLYGALPVVLLLASTANLVGDSYNPFIYFQF